MICSEILKEGTEKAHRNTEKVLLKRLKALRSDDDYVELLKILYGYYHPLQSSIRDYVSPLLLRDIAKRRSADRIVEDLRSMGYHGDLPLAPQLPQVASVAHAAGVLYVLEGSSLGGTIIAGMLRAKKTLLKGKSALSFFDGYGEDNVGMWKKFQTFLNDRFHREEEINEALAAAQQTFVGMEKWMAAR